MLADFFILILKGYTINIVALALLSATHLISLLINIFIFSVFARALLSWVNPDNFDAASSILTSLTEPLLNFSRKFIPDIAGIDLSPLIVLLLLQLAKMVILIPLYDLVSLVS
jgi:YggT family protein